MINLFTIDFISIGQQLQQRRIELRLTQEQIAERLSMSTKQLSRIECGQRPSLLTLIQLAAVLNISLDSLFCIYTNYDRTFAQIQDCLLHLKPEQRTQILGILTGLIDNQQNS